MDTYLFCHVTRAKPGNGTRINIYLYLPLLVGAVIVVVVVVVVVVVTPKKYKFFKLIVEGKKFLYKKTHL
jgi:hypothetical protein